MASLELEVRGVFVSILKSDVENIVEDKVHNGRKVKALMLSRIRAAGCYTAPTEKLAEAILATMPELDVKIQKKLATIFTDIYVKKNLTWTDENGNFGGEKTFFPQFQKTWNESNGDPMVCAEKLGKNEWDEWVLTAKDCVAKYNQATKVMENHGLVAIADSAIKHRGRAKMDVSALAKAISAELKTLI